MKQLTDLVVVSNVQISQRSLSCLNHSVAMQVTTFPSMLSGLEVGRVLSTNQEVVLRVVRAKMRARNLPLL